MSEQIRIVDETLHSAGKEHQGASDYLRGVPDTHPQIQAFLGSLGPIFGDLRAAGGTTLDQRKQCYVQQAQDHEHVANGLNQAATTWGGHEQGASEQFRGLSPQA